MWVGLELDETYQRYSESEGTWHLLRAWTGSKGVQEIQRLSFFLYLSKAMCLIELSFLSNNKSVLFFGRESRSVAPFQAMCSASPMALPRIPDLSWRRPPSLRPPKLMAWPRNSAIDGFDTCAGLD